MKIQEIANLNSEKEIKEELKNRDYALAAYSKNISATTSNLEQEFIDLKSVNAKFIYVLFLQKNKHNIDNIKYLLRKNDFEILKQVVDKANDKQLATFFTKKKISFGNIFEEEFDPLLNKLINAMSSEQIAKMAINNDYNDKTYDFFKRFMTLLIKKDPDIYFDSYFKTMQKEIYFNMGVFFSYELKNIDKSYFEEFLKRILQEGEYTITKDDKSEYDKFENYITNALRPLAMISSSVFPFDSIDFSIVEDFTNYIENTMLEISDKVEDEKEGPRILSKRYTVTMKDLKTSIITKLFQNTEIPSIEKLKEFEEYAKFNQKAELVLNNIKKAEELDFSIIVYIESGYQHNILLTDPDIIEYSYMFYGEPSSNFNELYKFNYDKEVCKKLKEDVEKKDPSKLKELKHLVLFNSNMTPEEQVEIGLISNVDVYNDAITTIFETSKDYSSTDFILEKYSTIHTYNEYLKVYDQLKTKKAIKNFLKYYAGYVPLNKGIDQKKKKEHANKIWQLFNKE